MLLRLIVLAAIVPFAAVAAPANAQERAWRAPTVLAGAEPFGAAVTVGADGLVTTVHTDTAGSQAPELLASIGRPGDTVVPVMLHPDAYEVDSAVDAAGNVVAVWNTYDGEIRAARKQAGATEFGAAHVVARRTSQYPSQPSSPRVAVNADGAAVVHFVRQDVGLRRGLPSAAFAPPAESFGEPVPVGDEVDLQPFYDRRAVLTGDGTAVLAWVDESSPFMGRVVVATGRADQGFAPPAPVSAEGRAAGEVRAVATDGPHAAIAWAERAPPREVRPGLYEPGGNITFRLAQRRSDGSFPSETVPGAEEHGRSMDIAASRTELFVAYSGLYGLRVATAPHLAPLGALESPVGNDSADDVHLAVNAAGSGQLIFDGRGPAGDGWETSSRLSGRTFGPAQDLGPCLVRLWRDLAIGPEGTAAAAYIQGTPTGAGGDGSVMAVSVDRAAQTRAGRTCTGSTGMPTDDPFPTPAPPAEIAPTPPPPPTAPPPAPPQGAVGSGGAQPGGIQRRGVQPQGLSLRVVAPRRRGRSVVAHVRCAKACRLRLGGVVSGTRRRPWATPGHATTLQGGSTESLRLRLTGRNLRSVRGALRRNRRVDIVVTATATGFDGTSQKVSRRVRVRRI